MITVNTDLAGGGLLVAIAAAALIAARGATFNVWVFPRVTGAFLAVVGAGLVIKGLVAPDRREVLDRSSAWTAVLPFAIGLVAYGIGFSRLGFVPTTIVLYAAATWLLRREFTLRSGAISLAISAAVTLLLYQVFTRLFYVPLPGGTLW